MFGGRFSAAWAAPKNVRVASSSRFIGRGCAGAFTRFTSLEWENRRGGGITPDVVVKAEELSKLVTDLARKNLFFKFAVQHVREVEEIPKDKAADPARIDDLVAEYHPNERSLSAFKKFLTSNKVTIDESEFKK